VRCWGKQQQQQQQQQPGKDCQHSCPSGSNVWARSLLLLVAGRWSRTKNVVAGAASRSSLPLLCLLLTLLFLFLFLLVPLLLLAALPL
jgi:hypothetical protein